MPDCARIRGPRRIAWRAGIGLPLPFAGGWLLRQFVWEPAVQCRADRAGSHRRSYRGNSAVRRRSNRIPKGIRVCSKESGHDLGFREDRRCFPLVAGGRGFHLAHGQRGALSDDRRVQESPALRSCDESQIQIMNRAIGNTKGGWNRYM
jgi:hypothetical protein